MKLSEIVDIDELRALCESFTVQTSAATAILDLDGTVVIATGWQEICTGFHRVHPVTAQRCRESDTLLAGQLRQGQQYNVYKCKNGLVDVAVPIIIEDEHIANFFTGQFFFEAPDREYFIRQADEFGFDKGKYIEALNRVPVFSEEQIRALMEFFTRLTHMIAKMGLAQKRQNEIQGELALKHRQLEELNRTLESRVDTAIAELRIKDQQIIQQNRQAAMGEMIHNIAHQWKQPLNNLSLLIQAMSFDFSDGALTPDSMEIEIRKCLDQISFMSQTIDDFRYFFRADKQKEPFGVFQSIERALRLLSASLKHHNIKIVVEPGSEVNAIGYPNEYSQVLLNIVGNARDVFIEKNIAAPVIKIKVFSDADRAVVLVNDNGGGIAPDVINNIFDPYFTTKESGKGSGIGLSMSKNIIEQHMGGSLTVDNIDGGVQFRIVVPMDTTIVDSNR